MRFTKTLMAAAALSLALPLAARANDQWRPAEPQPVQANLWEGDRAPDARHARRGRYEQRVVQRWVEGRYEQVWVPEQCFQGERQRGWWRQAGTYCVPAHYDQRWVPGHYQQVTQWVWVPFKGHGHHGRGHGHGHGWGR